MAKLVSVTWLRQHGLFNGGEKSGVPLAEAIRLKAAGIVRLNDSKEDKGDKTASVRKAAKSALKEAKKTRTAAGKVQKSSRKQVNDLKKDLANAEKKAKDAPEGDDAHTAFAQAQTNLDLAKRELAQVEIVTNQAQAELEAALLAEKQANL